MITQIHSLIMVQKFVVYPSFEVRPMPQYFKNLIICWHTADERRHYIFQLKLKYIALDT